MMEKSKTSPTLYDVRLLMPGGEKARDMTFHGVRGVYCEYDDGSSIRFGRILKEIKPASCENTPVGRSKP